MICKNFLYLEKYLTMDFIKGYKPITYSELNKELNKAFDTSEKSYPDLAVAAGVTSTQTIKFVFESEDQKVSDKVLTSVLNALGINGLIVWFDGGKHYLVKSKN